MAEFRERPYSGRHFLVDLGTGDTESPQAAFTEVHLPEACMEVLEYRLGNDKTSGSRKHGGCVCYTNVVLKRGCIGSLDLYEWWDDVRDGSVDAHRTVTIQLLSEDHTTVAIEWKLINARPVCYRFSPLNAQNDEIVVEIIELAFERLEMS